jgi:DNA-binding NtrC family response regulator
MGKANILIVEDDSMLCQVLHKLLARSGYGMTDTLAYGEQVIESIENKKPDLVLMDIWLKGELNGIEVTKEINKRWDIPVIYVTAHTDKNTLEKINETKHYGYIQKPINYMELQTTIDTVLQMKDLG